VQEQVWTERRTEIARGHQQLGRPPLAAVVVHVAQEYGQGESVVRRRTRRPGEPRQVAVYAARRIAGRDLQTIGGYFGLSYPAVSRRVHALEVALRHGVRLRKRVDKVLGAIIDVKPGPRLRRISRIQPWQGDERIAV
jgi:chromosomal replication initiation ATPase DnaA